LARLVYSLTSVVAYIQQLDQFRLYNVAVARCHHGFRRRNKRSSSVEPAVRYTQTCAGNYLHP